MEQVFISYSRRDLVFVKRLSADLQAAGLKVWYDLSGLEAGTRWGREIQNALRESRYFLVVLSPNSCESEWVEREFLFASNQKLKVIPILYRECELPLWSLNLHFMELREENYIEGMGDLLRILGVKPQPEQPVVEVVASPVITPEIMEEPAPAGSGQEEKQQPAVPAVEVPVIQLKTEEIPPLVAKKEQVEVVTAPILEKKEEPAVAVEEKKVKKPAKVKPVPRVKEKIKTPPRPGVKKAWVLGLGGLAGVIILVLGIVFFGGDIKAALFPDKATQTQPQAEIFVQTVSLEITSIATLPIDPDGIRYADGMKMVTVPEGEFTMGSDDGKDDEKPAHQVSLDAYWMDQTEVTNDMYAMCVSSGNCQPPQWPSLYTSQHWYSPITWPDFPVVYVDWNNAKTYCEWAGGRLPTEAEWEKAARGLDGRMYPWGNDEPTDGLATYMQPGSCWSSVDDYSSGASPYGIYNLAGNVWEWVADWYGAYSGSLVRNPIGPESGEGKVLRGGSCESQADSIRTTFRFSSQPSSFSDSIGFRCAYSPSEAVPTAAEASPAVTALPTAQAASISPTDGMAMVKVPAGEFTMGSDDYKDSQPVHTVYLDDFWIDQTEVTNEMYQLCVSVGDCDAPVIAEESTRPDYFYSSVYKDYPVIQVDWNNAQAYCEWAGRRLPTEAEWEKAARGTDGRRYPWEGTDFSCELAIYNPGAYTTGCGGQKGTLLVGSVPGGASPYGALDMVGNVAEWVADWYSASYYNESPATNPPGPVTGEDHVLRGSSFRNIKLYLTTFYRRWGAPYGTGDDIGFRCASSTAP